MFYLSGDTFTVMLTLVTRLREAQIKFMTCCSPAHIELPKNIPTLIIFTEAGCIQSGAIPSEMNGEVINSIRYSKMALSIFGAGSCPGRCHINPWQHPLKNIASLLLPLMYSPSVYQQYQKNNKKLGRKKPQLTVCSLVSI